MQIDTYFDLDDTLIYTASLKEDLIKGYATMLWGKKKIYLRPEADEWVKFAKFYGNVYLCSYSSKDIVQKITDYFELHFDGIYCGEDLEKPYWESRENTFETSSILIDDKGCESLNVIHKIKWIGNCKLKQCKVFKP